MFDPRLNQSGQEPSAATSYRYSLWLILALTTALDAALAAAIFETHGILFGWWLYEKARTDPLIGFVVAEILLLRMGLFMLALRLAGAPRWQRFSTWLALVPLLGAPMLLAAMLAHEDDLA